MGKFGIMCLGVWFFLSDAGWRDDGVGSKQEKPSLGAGRALEHVSAGTRCWRS